MSSRRGGGQPRLSRGIIDLGSDDWRAPEAVVLDTSAVVDFLLPSQRDAVHAATAILTETPLIATTDTGFATLPESALQIISDPHRVPQMRRRRAQWASRRRT